jgi:hypothetical protein
MSNFFLHFIFLQHSYAAEKAKKELNKDAFVLRNKRVSRIQEMYYEQ